MDHVAVTVPAPSSSFLQDARLMRLALKYSYLWKTRCEALRAKTYCRCRCSVHHVVVRAFDGTLQVLRREQLSRIKAGAEPYGNGRVRARIREVPAQLPPDIHFVPLDITTYLGTDTADFMSLLFTAPTRVYVMLPTLMREPKWLRDLFVKTRDPATGNHMGLPVSWHFGSGFALLLASGMRYQAFVRQRLMIWESIKTYDMDEELLLGGPCLAEMGDTLFVVATRSVPADPGATQLAQPLQVQQQAPPLSRVGPPLRLVVGSGDGAVGGGLSSPSPTGTPTGATVAAAAGSPTTILVSRDAAAAAQRDFDTSAPQTDVGPSQLFYRRTGDGINADGGGGGLAAVSTAVLSGSGWLLQRFVKAVKRDRVQDLRALLQSGPWQRYCMSADEVSFLPPGERHPLAVDLAVSNMSLPLLVELVDRAGCHLNYRALKFLVSQWDRLPEHAAGGGEGLMMRYLVRQPNPLSVIGACLLAMRSEVAAGRNHSSALQNAVPRFKAVHAELLNQVQDSYFRISEEARVEASLPLLEDILEQPQAMIAMSGAGTGAGGTPPLQPVVLSDYSPLRLAFRDHDTQFMSAQLIEAYTRRRWLGPEYGALTSLDGHNRLSGLDPLLVYTIVENLGFVGDAGSPSMRATFRLWHLLTMTSPAFFSSPRGRWAMKFMSTLAFLGMYMVVLMTYKQVRLPASKGGDAWRVVHTAFVVFTAGNLLEGVEVMAMRYRNSAGRYFMSAPGEVLGILVDVGIFSCVTPCLVVAYADNAGGGGVHPGGSHLSTAQWTMLRMAISTLAIFVWMRSLLIMVPLYRKLGPLIRTMNRMAGEILAFVPLYVSVTLGFAAAFNSTIGDELAPYRTFIGSVLQLFEATLGAFDYDEFDSMDERKRVYSIVLMTVYLVLAALLLTNLLIAIISYKYRPEEVRAESVFDLAEMVDRYRFQVKHHLICSPFNLLLLLFAWLPASPMPKLPPYEWVKYGLTPLDGLTFAIPGYPNTTGGRHEIPHLCYLLTLYPIMFIVANVLYFLHTPYTVLYWACTGHRKLLRELLGDHSSGAAATAAGLPGAAAGPAAAGDVGGGAPGRGRLAGVVSRKPSAHATSPNSPPGFTASVQRSGALEQATAAASMRQPQQQQQPPPPQQQQPSPPPPRQQGDQQPSPPPVSMSLRKVLVSRDALMMGLQGAGASTGAAPSIRSADSRGSAGWLELPILPVDDEEPSGSQFAGRTLGSGAVIERHLALPLPPRGGAGPVAEKLEASGGGAGADVSLASPSIRGTWSQNGGPDGLRARSLKSMQVYATSRDTGGASSCNMSGHLEEASLYDDVCDAADVQPPYMELLRLATLNGLRDAVLSAARFIVLVMAGTVLYVFVMGVLAGTLGCCLTVWLASVMVSVVRIIVGAWRGARSGEAWVCSSGPADQDREGAASGGATGGGRGYYAGSTGGSAPGAKGRWVSLARMARLRAKRCTYLTKPQVEDAVRSVYTAASILSAGPAPVGWASVASRVYGKPTVGSTAAAAVAPAAPSALQTILSGVAMEVQEELPSPPPAARMSTLRAVVDSDPQPRLIVPSKRLMLQGEGVAGGWSSSSPQLHLQQVQLSSTLASAAPVAAAAAAAGRGSEMPALQSASLPPRAEYVIGLNRQSHGGGGGSAGGGGCTSGGGIASSSLERGSSSQGGSSSGCGGQGPTTGRLQHSRRYTPPLAQGVLHSGPIGHIGGAGGGGGDGGGGTLSLLPRNHFLLTRTPPSVRRLEQQHGGGGRSSSRSDLMAAHAGTAGAAANAGGGDVADGDVLLPIARHSAGGGRQGGGTSGIRLGDNDEGYVPVTMYGGSSVSIPGAIASVGGQAVAGRLATAGESVSEQLSVMQLQMAELTALVQQLTAAGGGKAAAGSWGRG